ncbi:hypothetical protein ACJH6I_29140, partial [Mycobacterium sp. SMC-13]
SFSRDLDLYPGNDAPTTSTPSSVKSRFTGDGTQHMEYLCDRGAYDDLPLADILQALKSHYGSFIDQPNSSPDLFA